MNKTKTKKLTYEHKQIQDMSWHKDRLCACEAGDPNHYEAGLMNTIHTIHWYIEMS